MLAIWLIMTYSQVNNCDQIHRILLLLETCVDCSDLRLELSSLSVCIYTTCMQTTFRRLGWHLYILYRGRDLSQHNNKLNKGNLMQSRNAITSLHVLLWLSFTQAWTIWAAQIKGSKGVSSYHINAVHHSMSYSRNPWFLIMECDW